MMDMSPPERGGSRYEIMLISMNNRYWLVKGEKHLDALLSGSEDFPKPVGCLFFKSHARMQSFLPGGLDLSSLWMIQPGIVIRLREEQHLVELFPEG